MAVSSAPGSASATWLLRRAMAGGVLTPDAYALIDAVPRPTATPPSTASASSAATARCRPRCRGAEGYGESLMMVCPLPAFRFQRAAWPPGSGRGAHPVCALLELSVRRAPWGLDKTQGRGG